MLCYTWHCIVLILVAIRQPVYKISAMACENLSKYYPIGVKFSGHLLGIIKRHERH